MPEREADVTFEKAGSLVGRLQEPGVTIEFRGEIYDWMRELAKDLKDAEQPADVAKMGIELLYLARGKQVVLLDATSEKTLDLWRRSRA